MFRQSRWKGDSFIVFYPLKNYMSLFLLLRPWILTNITLLSFRDDIPSIQKMIKQQLLQKFLQLPYSTLWTLTTNNIVDEWRELSVKATPKLILLLNNWVTEEIQREINFDTYKYIICFCQHKTASYFCPQISTLRLSLSQSVYVCQQ